MRLFSRVRLQLLALGILAVLSTSLLAACGSSGTSTSTSTPTIRVGLVTDIGGLNDKGFNHLAYLGLQQAISQLHVQGQVEESHSGNDYVPNLTTFAQQHYDLVIAVGFLMAQAVGTVAQQFPTVKFAIIDSTASDANGNSLTLQNVAPLLFHEEQAGALVGVIAGMLEKAGTAPKDKHIVSTVGGVKIPPVDHYIAGFQWGAKHEDPSIKTLNGYSNDFTDPTKCAGVANSQIGQGSNVVFQVAGGCGLGALEAAGKAGVYSIGVDTDQSSADASVIASAVKRVDQASFLAIQSVVQGKFTGGSPTFFDLSNGGVGYAPGNITLPPDIVTEVMNVEAQIKSNAVTVPNTVP
jgi:basic membrane protein A and related proteins